MVFNLYLKNIWISFKTQIRKGKIRKSLYTGLTDDSNFLYVVTQLSESGQVHTQVKPTIFEINVGAVVQNIGFPGCFKIIYTG